MAGESSAGASTLRRSGFTLIAVAVVSAVVGVVTIAAGSPERAAKPPEGRGNAGAPRTTAAPTTTSQTRSPRPSATSQVVQPSDRATPSPSTTSHTVPTTQASGNVQGKGRADRSAPQIPLRVYNNSNIGGLAHRAAEDLRQAGYVVAEIGNYSGGIIPTTTVYYRRGTAEKAQAEEIAGRFGMRAKPRFDGIDDASPGIIVIVTKSYDGMGK